MQAQGVTFTQASRQELALLLRQRLAEGALRMPFDRDTLDELNVERYELTKTGRIAFSHQDGTHDDRFWVLALAVHAAEKSEPTPSKPLARTT